LKTNFNLFLICLTVFSGCFLLISQLDNFDSLNVDEIVHYPQILAFMDLDFQLDPKLTTFPGYHIVMAVLGSSAHTSQLVHMRIITSIIGLLTAMSIVNASMLINKSQNIFNYTHRVFFPLFVPFYFMIYTDILSLLVFNISLIVGLRKNYQLSAFFCLINLLVRQNTFFWLCFLFFLFFAISFQEVNWNNIKKYLRQSWLFVLVILLFLIFVIANRGVAIGDREMHPALSVHFGNMFLYLFLSAVLILPLCLDCIKVFDFKLTHYAIIVLFLLIYYFNSDTIHPYNQVKDPVYIRNTILSLAQSSILGKTLYFIPILFGIILHINLYKRNSRIFGLYCIFGLLSLLPSWLIDPRYYLINMLLLGYMSSIDIPQKRGKLIVVHVIYFIFGLCLLYGSFSGNYYL
jgi:alpha-1,2-glucosyltransferase